MNKDRAECFIAINMILFYVGGFFGFCYTLNPIYLLFPLCVIVKAAESLDKKR